MKNYPTWWNQTITVYNKFEDPQTRVITWHRTVLDNCFWKYVGETVKAGSITIETDATICRIPENPKYLPKYKWNNLGNDLMSAYFTLSVGDIVVLGESTDEISEYTSGQRSSDIVTKHKKLQGCMVIKTVSINVGGDRGNEHYLVKGI